VTATLTDAGLAPGIHQLSHADYHADPALSSTGARKLTPPSCPALFRYEQDNPPEPRRVFDFGTAAHNRLLGTGPEIVVIDAADRRKKATQETIADAHLDGKVPLLRKDYDVVLAMVAALETTPGVRQLLDRDWGTPETSVFWRDEPTGVMRRARLDWCPHFDPARRSLLVDYKTAASADPDKFVKSAADYGYHQQADWYRTGAIATGLAGSDAKFLFIAQEKTPPYLASVIELDTVAMRIGALLNRRALDLYARCVETDTWPGYVDDVALVSLPPWYERQFTEDL
jgi:hypothetical protein